MGPTSDRFMALARSSPWRWSTLRFSVTWAGTSARWPEPMRAWVRRPDAVRVETLGGDLVYSDVRTVSWGQSRVVMTSDGPQRVPAPRAPLDPAAPQPWVDDEGLVRHRPDDDGRVFYDDPMFQNYHWVAMLDPVELADGDGLSAPPASHPVALDRIADANHLGRWCWEAVVRTTSNYVPRCSCCALLFGPEILAAGPVDERWLEAGFRFPTEHRVRLDWATGVCVMTEELDGSGAGAGHDLVIEAVDEPMADDLFERRGPAAG